MGEQTATIPAFFFLILFLFQVITPSQGELRLQDGGSNYGRLEILYNGVWGTICDDSFGLEDARVACRELGLDAFVVNTFDGARYGEGTGTIWLDEVECSGSEPSIDSCSHNGYGSHDCSHSEDVSISCGTIDDPMAGELRLVDGGPNYGRLEVSFNGVWGTICDDDFDVFAARVACRQLGLDTVTVDYYPNARFGQGTGPILLDNVNCVGSESILDSCSHNDYGSHDCTHSEDVGISCGTTNVGGSSSSSFSGVGSWIGGAVFIVVICIVAVMIRRRRLYAMRQRRSTTAVIQPPVTTTVHITSTTNAPGTTPMPTYQHTPAQQQQPGGPRPYPTQPFTPTYPPASTGGAPPANPYPVQAYPPATQHPAQPPVQPPSGAAPYPPQQAGAAPYPPPSTAGAAPYPPPSTAGAAPYPPPSTAGPTAPYPPPSTAGPTAPYPPQQPVDASAAYPPQSNNAPEVDLPPPPSYDDIVKQ